MSDCIYRQAVIDAVEYTDWYHQNRNGEMVHGANSAEDQAWYKADDIYKALKAVPSADVVEVVRCEYCKHADEYYQCDYSAIWNDKNHYCGKGERKDG